MSSMIVSFEVSHYRPKHTKWKKDTDFLPGKILLLDQWVQREPSGNSVHRMSNMSVAEPKTKKRTKGQLVRQKELLTLPSN